MSISKSKMPRAQKSTICVQPVTTQQKEMRNGMPEKKAFVAGWFWVHFCRTQVADLFWREVVLPAAQREGPLKSQLRIPEIYATQNVDEGVLDIDNVPVTKHEWSGPRPCGPLRSCHRVTALRCVSVALRYLKSVASTSPLWSRKSSSGFTPRNSTWAPCSDPRIDTTQPQICTTTQRGPWEDAGQG